MSRFSSETSTLYPNPSYDSSEHTDSSPREDIVHEPEPEPQAMSPPSVGLAHRRDFSTVLENDLAAGTDRKRSSSEIVFGFVDDDTNLQAEVQEAVMYERRRRGYPTVWLTELSLQLLDMLEGRADAVHRPRGFVSTKMKRFDCENMSSEEVIEDIVDDPITRLPMEVPERGLGDLHFATAVSVHNTTTRVLLAAMYRRQRPEEQAIALTPYVPPKETHPSPQVRSPTPPTAIMPPPAPVSEPAPHHIQPHPRPQAAVVASAPLGHPALPSPKAPSPSLAPVDPIMSSRSPPIEPSRDIMVEIARMRDQIAALELEMDAPPAPARTHPGQSAARPVVDPLTQPTQSTHAVPADTAQAARRSLASAIGTLRTSMSMSTPSTEDLRLEWAAVQQLTQRLAGHLGARTLDLAGMGRVKAETEADATPLESLVAAYIDPSGLDVDQDVTPSPCPAMEAKLTQYARLLAVLAENPDVIAQTASRMSQPAARERLLTTAFARICDHELSPPVRAGQLLLSVAATALPQLIADGTVPACPTPDSPLEVALSCFGQRGDVLGFIRAGLDQVVSDVAGDTSLPAFATELAAKNYSVIPTVEALVRVAVDALAASHTVEAVPAAISLTATQLRSLVARLAPAEAAADVRRAIWGYTLFVTAAPLLIKRHAPTEPQRTNVSIIIGIIAAAALPVGSPHARLLQDAPWTVRLEPIVASIRPQLGAILDSLSSSPAPESALLNDCQFAGDMLVVTAADLAFLHRTIVAYIGDLPAIPDALLGATHALGPGLPRAPVRRSECPVYTINIPVPEGFPTVARPEDTARMLDEAEALLEELDLNVARTAVIAAEHMVHSIAAHRDNCLAVLGLHDRLTALAGVFQARIDDHTTLAGMSRATRHATTNYTETTANMTPQCTPAITLGPPRTEVDTRSPVGQTGLDSSFVVGLSMNSLPEAAQSPSCPGKQPKMARRAPPTRPITE